MLFVPKRFLVVRHKEASTTSLLNEIKGEAEAWLMAV
jgi:hypothetical protein